jgi:hypothetical protein
MIRYLAVDYLRAKMYTHEDLPSAEDMRVALKMTEQQFPDNEWATYLANPEQHRCDDRAVDAFWRGEFAVRHLPALRRAALSALFVAPGVLACDGAFSEEGHVAQSGRRGSLTPEHLAQLVMRKCNRHLLGHKRPRDDGSESQTGTEEDSQKCP